ncbi:hypothetical protein DBR32_07740 [Taibaiella sp. KBW10]|uniref:DUF1266 domain-containing protein n=1 Tax=Taibaiella sp. KBW10 TaxID=2153357 RepID=UPI000F5AA2AF|nr:DUF1266 domain-containing protein [Taibaiella sp. KBW10]RQO30618.1 hypothetical protein DBR32_07740 [Taibaiella sp. KBW10]
MAKNLHQPKYRFLLLLDIMMWKHDLASVLDMSVPLWQKHIKRLQKIDKLFGDQPDPAEEQKEKEEFTGDFWIYQITQKASKETKQALELSEDYDIHNRQDALKILEWLQTEGHRKDAKELFDASPELLPEFSITTFEENKILAWDMARFINVLKRSLILGYISEEEMTQKLDQIYPMIAGRYASWQSYVADYKLGNLIWQVSLLEEQADEDMEAAFNEDNKHIEENVAVLLHHELSPWTVFDIRKDYTIPEPPTEAKTGDKTVVDNSRKTGLQKYWWVLLLIGLLSMGLKIYSKWSQKQNNTKEQRMENLKKKLQEIK